MEEHFCDTRRRLRAWICEHPVEGVPVDIFSVARCLGVVEIEPRIMSFDGYLAKRRDGKFAIRYKSGQELTRTRFTVAHEVGHIIHSIVSGTTIDGILARGSNRCDANERHANFVAAELLMPEEFVSDYLRKREVHWSRVWELAALMKVSKAAILRRITELRSVFAVDLRVTWPQTDLVPEILIRSSPSGSMLLRTPPQSIANTILGEMLTRSTHRIPISLDGVDLDLICNGRLTHSESGSMYHLIGWIRL